MIGLKYVKLTPIYEQDGKIVELPPHVIGIGQGGANMFTQLVLSDGTVATVLYSFPELFWNKLDSRAMLSVDDALKNPSITQELTTSIRQMKELGGTTLDAYRYKSESRGFLVKERIETIFQRIGEPIL